MTMRTKGDLCGFGVSNETTYGITNSVMEFGGVLTDLETPDNPTIEYDQACGSRKWQNVIMTLCKYGFKATFTAPKFHATQNTVRWVNWLIRATGGTLGQGGTAPVGIQNEIPSVSAFFRVASDEGILSTGAKINNLDISADAVGAPLKFTVDALARLNVINTSVDASGRYQFSIENRSYGLFPKARPNTAPVCYTTKWMHGASPINAKSWVLRIANSLNPDPGISTDGKGLEAGTGSAPNDSTIELDLTITSVGPEWDRLKEARTAGQTFSITIDGVTVTLSNCYIKPGLPSRKQSSYDETITIVAQDITASL